MNKSLIYSISSSPGKFGVKLYNKLFEIYSLPLIYKTLCVTDTEAFHELLYTLETTDKFFGLSISMPFKEIAYNYFKTKKYFSCPRISISLNTLKKENKLVKGTLTDYFIFKEFNRKLSCNINHILIYGNGAMSKLAFGYFSSKDYKCSVIERNDLPEALRTCRRNNNIAFINATPIDLSGFIINDKSKYPILDLPVRINQKKLRDSYFSGYWATKIQFKHQFQFYTDIEIEMNTIEQTCYQIFGF